MVRMEDIKAIVKDLRRKEENIHKFIEKQGTFMAGTTKSMLLSDADLFKRYAEMANDLTGEDLLNQELIGEFIQFKDKAVSGTLYEVKIKPVENAL